MNKGFVAPLALVIIGLAIAAVFYFIYTNQGKPTSPVGNFLPELTREVDDAPAIEVFAQNLNVPWAIAFLPNGELLVTERSGNVRLVSAIGEVNPDPVAEISVRQTSESGLHGITLHPDFENNNYVYLYYTYADSGENTMNRVSRFTYENEQLVNEQIIVDAIPGAPNHDGGRIKFGPDGFLYITTGDAQQPSLAQDTASLAGKILRVTDSGDPVAGNSFDSAQDKRIYSYGHRNPQGIAWDLDGNLYETEHGPSGSETGNDEFNLVEIGKNYGWPEIRGTETRNGMVTPILESGRSETWAPAGLAFLNGSFYFAGLRGATLYQVDVSGTPEITRHLVGEYGRLREVVAGPDGLLYVTTSNRDGRGTPRSGDDKILRINPAKL